MVEISSTCGPLFLSVTLPITRYRIPDTVTVPSSDLWLIGRDCRWRWIEVGSASTAYGGNR